MTLTIRAHLERIVERNAPTRPHHDPGDDYRDAVAALKALDEAAVVGGMPRDGDPHLRPVPHRLVPDPAPPTENTT